MVNGLATCSHLLPYCIVLIYLIHDYAFSFQIMMTPTNPIPTISDSEEEEEIIVEQILSNDVTVTNDVPNCLLDANKQLLSSTTHGDITFYGFEQTKPLLFLFHWLALLSVFSLYLVCHWKPEWKVYLTCKRSSLFLATHLIVEVNIFNLPSYHCLFCYCKFS